MVPIPSDLLALPFTSKSDPLRGPIFVPLHTECLMENKQFLFEGATFCLKYILGNDLCHFFTEFREDTYVQRLFLFQEAILQRFGFLPCLNESSENDHQYVHITGNAFILIPFTNGTRTRPKVGINVVRRNTGQKRYPVHPDQPSPREAYITRHVSGKNKDDYNIDRKVRKFFF